MRLSYIFASRSRPEKFFNCLNNIRDLSACDNYEIIASLDLDDATMNNDLVTDTLHYYPGVKPFWGMSDSKVHAINREAWRATGDIICCHSDDFVFLKQGFDDIIREWFKDFSGLLHFPDGFAGSKLCTYPILDRAYFEKFGYIYNPAYVSVYSDNEMQDVAKILGQYKFVDYQIFEHQHPCWGFGKMDALLARTESAAVYAEDRATYNERKLKNFGL